MKPTKAVIKSNTKKNNLH